VRTPGYRLIGLTAAVIALNMISLGYKGWAAFVAHLAPEDTNYTIYYGPLARADAFTWGMLLALLVVALRYRPILRRPAPALMRVTGLSLFAVLCALRPGNALIAVYFHTFTSLFFILVLASTVLGPRGARWERALMWPPLRGLGLISYSVYLWQEPIMIFLEQHHIVDFQGRATFLLAVLVLLFCTLAVGTASYWLIEYPTAYLRHLFTREGGLAQRYPVG